MCNYCGFNPCRCQNTTNFNHSYINCGPTCTDTGCPILLDWSCSIYHKSNNQISELTNLGLDNGATLELFAISVDALLGQLNVPDYSLACLREDYTIDTLEQFAEAVDVELCLIKDDVAALEASGLTPITANDSETIDFTTSGVLQHTITADVKISADANNQLTAEPDGLYSSPQTLSINYVARTLTIADGNTVSFASITAGTLGWLGNFTGSDPTAIDGQYWFRTDTSQIKMRVNSTTRVITST